jgi:hypothetical protein
MNRLILSQGSTFSVGAGSSLTNVFGTAAGAETISIALGAKVVLDASFNRGGDVISLSGNAASYTAVQSGSSIILTPLQTPRRAPCSSIPICAPLSLAPIRSMRPRMHFRPALLCRLLRYRLLLLLPVQRRLTKAPRRCCVCKPLEFLPDHSSRSPSAA